MALSLKFTKAGRQALINTSATGTAETMIVSVGITPAEFVFDENMTTLPSEYKRITTIGGKVLDGTLISMSIMDESTDTYTAHAFGLYLTDDTLLAVCVGSDPILEKSPDATLLTQFDIAIVGEDVDIGSITFGNTVFHNPPATMTVEGVVRMATDAEADDGTLGGNVALSPKQVHKYKTVPATITTAGIARIATLQEALEGHLAGNVFVSPATLEEALRLRGVPMGSYLWAPFEAPPQGYLRANGATLSPIIYADLFKVIGTRYGGNGTTTFMLPEVRGEFPRVWDDGRGVDPSRVLGEFQESTTVPEWIGNYQGALTLVPSNTDGAGVWQPAFSVSTQTSQLKLGARYNRIRPRNIAMACFIYAFYPRSL